MSSFLSLRINYPELKRSEYTCQLFLTQRREIVHPGSAKIFEDDTTISEDVLNNSEDLKRMIMLHTDLQKSEISGKY